MLGGGPSAAGKGRAERDNEEKEDDNSNRMKKRGCNTVEECPGGAGKRGANRGGGGADSTQTRAGTRTTRQMWVQQFLA